MASLRPLLPFAILLSLCAASGCLPSTSEAAFIGDAVEVSCGGVYPVCRGKYAGCVLDPQKFMRGTFPGARKFLVRTKPGDWTIRVSLFLSNQRAPGTETELSWYEPGCSDQYRFQLSKESRDTDLFEKAGRDQVFDVEKPVVEAGDHLIELFSDATVLYALRVDVFRTPQ